MYNVQDRKGERSCFGGRERLPGDNRENNNREDNNREVKTEKQKPRSKNREEKTAK